MVELVRWFEWLKDEVIGHGHDVNFGGDSVDVLFHAQHMLGDHIVTMNPPPQCAATL